MNPFGAAATKQGSRVSAAEPGNNLAAAGGVEAMWNCLVMVTWHAHTSLTHGAAPVDFLLMYTCWQHTCCTHLLRHRQLLAEVLQMPGQLPTGVSVSCWYLNSMNVTWRVLWQSDHSSSIACMMAVIDQPAGCCTEADTLTVFLAGRAGVNAFCSNQWGLLCVRLSCTCRCGVG